MDTLMLYFGTHTRIKSEEFTLETHDLFQLFNAGNINYSKVTHFLFH